MVRLAFTIALGFLIAVSTLAIPVSDTVLGIERRENEYLEDRRLHIHFPHISGGQFLNGLKKAVNVGMKVASLVMRDEAQAIQARGLDDTFTFTLTARDLEGMDDLFDLMSREPEPSMLGHLWKAAKKVVKKAVKGKKTKTQKQNNAQTQPPATEDVGGGATDADVAERRELLDSNFELVLREMLKMEIYKRYNAREGLDLLE